MKKNYLFLFILMALASFGWGQTTTIDFESAGDGYTPSSTEGSGYTDVFNRSNPDLGGNSSYLWAVEDLSLTNPYIDLDQIDITGATSFTFSIDMLAHHYNDWDDNDELLITYSIDGGAYQNLMWVQNNGGTYNQTASLDWDFDGDGECDDVLPSLTMGTSGCTSSTNTFETFSTSSIALSGNSTLNINLQFNGLTSTDEGIYLDNIVITQSVGAATPTITVSETSLTGFTYEEGNGPSTEQSFTISGSDLTDDISIDAPTNYEISTGTGGSFSATDPITLTQSGGSVSSTTIYVRLKSGLSIGNYNSEDIIATSTDASDKTVTCSGSVTGPTPDIIIARNCDPQNNYTPDRFAEIYNASSSAVDLTGWTLENVQNGSVEFSWSLSGNIQAGEILICGNDDNTGQTITPDFTALWSGISWNGKGGDGTILKDNTSTIVDYAVQNDGTGTFENAEMKRKLSVTSPSSVYDSDEWVFTSVEDANDVVPGFYGTVWVGGGTNWSTDGNWDCESPASN